MKVLLEFLWGGAVTNLTTIDAGVIGDRFRQLAGHQTVSVTGGAAGWAPHANTGGAGVMARIGRIKPHKGSMIAIFLKL
jgi:hypothetical protein